MQLRLMLLKKQMPLSLALLLTQRHIPTLKLLKKLSFAKMETML
jgi:hypothetical protein